MEEAGSRSRTPTLLLVDRDENCRRIYSTILEHRGYTVCLADECHEMEVVARHEPAAIVLDPWQCDDASVLLLRSAARERGIPIVALTSRATQEELAAISVHAFDLVLLKPTLPTALADAVDAMLAPRSFGDAGER